MGIPVQILTLRSATTVQRRQRRGFTLVELLVVIAIIGILVGLLMPAINGARERGRYITCTNNVRQLAMACVNFETKYQYLPGGGYAWGWTGDPKYGSGATQPGGWLYQILPFVDLVDLHDANPSTALSNGSLPCQIPVGVFNCPTRRKLQAWPFPNSTNFINLSVSKPATIGRADYAANSGGNLPTSAQSGGSFDDPYNAGQLSGSSPAVPDPNYPWATVSGTSISSSTYGGPSTGVIFRASQLPVALIKDGASFTFLAGEKYIDIPSYTTGTNGGDDQGWDSGYQIDVNRWTFYPPSQDRAAAYSNGVTCFGSAHQAGFNMACCDGSVKKVGYDIDPTIYLQMGNRADGGPLHLEGTGLVDQN